MDVPRTEGCSPYRRRNVLNRFTAGALSGGLAAYFFDPLSGEDRRERLMALWRDNQQSARQAGRAATQAAARMAPIARQIREGRWDEMFPRQREVPGVFGLLAAGVIGGTLAYFLDPDNGERRRSRVISFVQSTQEQAVEAGRQATANASGAFRQGMQEAGNVVQAAQSRMGR
jgi:gas vesicle protein